MKKPIVINLFGPPGSGKSTGAAFVFAELKMMGINAELVTEFAKDKTWENNTMALSCQEYVFGKQAYRLARCREDVDVIVTDSPLPLSIIYNENSALEDDFDKTVFNIFNTYDNLNFLIKRIKPYNPKGRNQTETESDELGETIIKFLKEAGIEYTPINGDRTGYWLIINMVVALLKLRS